MLGRLLWMLRLRTVLMRADPAVLQSSPIRAPVPKSVYSAGDEHEPPARAELLTFVPVYARHCGQWQLPLSRDLELLADQPDTDAILGAN